MKKYNKKHLAAAVALGLMLQTAVFTHAYAADATNEESTGEEEILLVSDEVDEYGIALLAIPEGTTTEVSAIAIGNNSETGGTNSIAIGTGSKALSKGSIAIGGGSRAENANSGVAIGNSARSLAMQASAFGYNAEASKSKATALGCNSVASGVESLAIGSNAQAAADSAVAMGMQAQAQGAFTFALGWKASTDAAADSAIAMGTESVANGKYSLALGGWTEAAGESSVAVGSCAFAGATNSLALGAFTTANYAGDVAIGSYSSTVEVTNVADLEIAGNTYQFAGGTPTSAVSFGGMQVDGSIMTRQLQYVAAGRITADSTDAVNGSQLFGVIDAIDNLSDRVTLLEADSGNGGGSGTTITDYVEKVEQNGDDLTFTQVSGTQDDGTPNTDSSFTYTDKHITDLAQSISGYTDADKGQLTTTITTNEKDDNGVNKTYEATVDISGYVSDAIKNEAGDAIITVDNTDTTIEEAINQNKENIDSNTARIDGLENNVLNNTNRINSLSNRVDKVGAGAAALAALHPIDYDAENKLSMAAGVGNYRGTQSGAVGAFYRPNEHTMLSLGSTFGNGEKMVNFGISFAVGEGVGPYRTKPGMAKMIANLQERNEQLQANVYHQSLRIAEQDNRIAEQDAKIAELMAKVETFLKQ